MSSIDKNVRTEALKLDSRVSVTTADNRITGRINGRVVFSIADRYGYINDSEIREIKRGIDAYKAEEERQRIEAENRRKSAREELKRELNNAKKALENSYKSAEKTIADFSKTLNSLSIINAPAGYDLSSFKDKIDGIRSDVNRATSTLNADYRAQRATLDGIVIGEYDSIDRYASLRSQVNRSKTISCKSLPYYEMETLRKQLSDVLQKINQIEELKTSLKNIKGRGLVAERIGEILKGLTKIKISSLGDADQVIANIKHKISEIEAQIRSEEIKADGSIVGQLSGLLRACDNFRVYSANNIYSTVSYKNEIERKISSVEGAFAQLKEAEYTTCSEERMEEIESILQEIKMKEPDDEQTLNCLKDLLAEYGRYKMDDELLESSYNDYVKKKNELMENGVAECDIEQFDTSDYATQKQRLNERLLKLDYEKSATSALRTLIDACATLGEMGYECIRNNLGRAQNEEEALAYEAVYAIKGCEGVAIQIVASENGIHRRLVPIKRQDGVPTSVERVLEVAKMMEESEEMFDFCDIFDAYTGSTNMVVSAVDNDTQGAEQVILENGYCELNAEEERRYDEIQSTADSTQRARWATKVTTCTKTVVNKNCKEEARRVASTVAKRYQEKRS